MKENKATLNVLTHNALLIIDFIKSDNNLNNDLISIMQSEVCDQEYKNKIIQLYNKAQRVGKISLNRPGDFQSLFEYFFRFKKPEKIKEEPHEVYFDDDDDDEEENNSKHKRRSQPNKIFIPENNLFEDYAFTESDY